MQKQGPGTSGDMTHAQWVMSRTRAGDSVYKDFHFNMQLGLARAAVMYVVMTSCSGVGGCTDSDCSDGAWSGILHVPYRSDCLQIGGTLCRPVAVY